MSEYRILKCSKCGEEKKSYLFEKEDNGVCIRCAKKPRRKLPTISEIRKRVAKTRKRPPLKRIPDTAPKPGTFYRARSEDKTRKQVKEVFRKRKILYVKYLAMEGRHAGKIRESRLSTFKRNHAPETEEDKDFKGWEKKKEVSKWKIDKLEWIERFGFNPGWDLGDET